MDYEPPFLKIYSNLLLQENQQPPDHHPHVGDTRNHDNFCELPLIDLGKLNAEREIKEAARKWGFFQVVNHGIPQELLDSLMHEQMIQVFHRPFATKCQEHFMNNLSSTAGSGYRWGNPSATSLRQLSWSEAFHVFLPDIATMDSHTLLRSSLECFGSKAASLAERLAEILGQEVNIQASYFRETCLPNTCFLRLNRYPACPVPSKVFGLLPHSDSSFLTIVYQNQLVGGLQLMKDGTWFEIKPNPQALLVNIGDLFQAVSNGVYRSIRHRVVASEKGERFSVAYFYSPSYEAVIESHDIGSPLLYRKFTFSEYKEQAEKDVKELGDKVGLSRFLL